MNFLMLIFLKRITSKNKTGLVYPLSKYTYFNLE